MRSRGEELCRVGRLLAFACALAGCCCGAGGGTARAAADAGGGEPTSLRIAEALSDAFSDVYEKVAPGVVVVRVSKREAEDQGAARAPDKGAPGAGGAVAPERKSEGTGFIVTVEGHIYTNQHVIAGAREVWVRLRDGRDLRARVLGADDLTDVAVLKVDGGVLACVEIGESDRVRVGQLVCAIGTPYNLEHSFTFGCVSGLGRGELHQANYEDYIQVDAAINPGNSGGPLFDLRGRVIGMNTLINGLSRGLGFAIPIALVDQVGRQIIERGRVVRPWIGVGIRCSLADHPARAEFGDLRDGVMVTVEAGGPAYRAGLRGTDVIVEIDGHPVRAGRDLQKGILRRAVGERVILGVWRAGRRERIEVVTAEFPATPPDAAGGTP